jgi:hypothetical protein
MVTRDGQSEESRQRLKRFAELYTEKAESTTNALFHAMNEAGLFGLERTIAQEAVERGKVGKLLEQK